MYRGPAAPHGDGHSEEERIKGAVVLSPPEGVKRVIDAQLSLKIISVLPSLT